MDENSGLVTATSGTYNIGGYYVQGGTVKIMAQPLRQDGSPIGAPAICPITVLGTGNRNSSINGGAGITF